MAHAFLVAVAVLAMLAGACRPAAAGQTQDVSEQIGGSPTLPSLPASAFRASVPLAEQPSGGAPREIAGPRALVFHARWRDARKSPLHYVTATPTPEDADAATTPAHTVSVD